MALPIAVLISGSGSNLQSMIDRIEQGVLEAEIRLVVSNNPKAYGLERAAKHGIKSVVLDHKAYADREEHDRAMVEAIREAGAEVVALAGFMRLLSPMFVSAFKNRILNIHPALLPSFTGTHGQKDAADYGVRISGATVHFVDEELDHGPIIIQAALPVRQGEDGEGLASRIIKLEHRIYPQAIQWLAQGRLSIEGRKVLLAPGNLPPAEIHGLEPCLFSPPLEQGF